MQDLIYKHLANGFSGFKGIRIEESLPVTEGTINELISEMQTWPSLRRTLLLRQVPLIWT